MQPPPVHTVDIPNQPCAACGVQLKRRYPMVVHGGPYYGGHYYFHVTCVPSGQVVLRM